MLSTFRTSLSRISVGIILLPFLYNFFFPSIWYSPELRAQVVAEDGRPVAGAAVVANWEIQNWISGSAEGQLAIFEAVTDENGRFSIPAWGPRFVLYGALDISAPIVRIVHPDFRPTTISNVEGIPRRARQ
jgi:hypothetical protein